MLLDFVVIGAQKSASTWLSKCISLHESITLPIAEYPCFEDEWPFSAGLSEHLNNTYNFGENKIIGIKNNNLLFKPESPQLLFDYNPDIKLVVVLRDPVERAISSYFWHLWVGMLPIQDINRGMRAVIEERNPLILEPGFYGQQLERYFSVFPRENVHIVRYEEVRLDRTKALKDTFQFLGVPYNFTEEQISFIAKPTVYNIYRLLWNNIRNPFIYKKTQDFYRVLWVNEANRSVIVKLVNSAVAGIDRLILAPILSNEKPLLTSELEVELKDLYREDRKKLEYFLKNKESQFYLK